MRQDAADVLRVYEKVGQKTSDVTSYVAGIIESIDSICDADDGAGTPIRFSGRLAMRLGTMVKGILKADAEDIRDA